MPWEVSSVLERRIRFVLDVERGELPLTACARRTGSAGRRATSGSNGMPLGVSAALGSAAHARPAGAGHGAGDCVGDRGGAHALSALGAEEAAGMVAARAAGGRLAGGIDDGRSAAPAWFERAAAWSAARAGADAPFAEAQTPHDLWCIDFKGWFARWTGNVATL
ncbi:MAG: hypothetical protein WDN04_09265 [Rhodospirillales bacterium]